jgi:hypothetical protein
VGADPPKPGDKKKKPAQAAPPSPVKLAGDAAAAAAAAGGGGAAAEEERERAKKVADAEFNGEVKRLRGVIEERYALVMCTFRHYTLFSQVGRRTQSCAQ